MPCAMRGLITGLIAATAVSVSVSGNAAYPIAGLQPDQRPSGAPTMEWVQHDKAWYEKALTGISRPYPKSLYFLDNQGYWYTPFNHPGIPGYYDLRGWHRH